MPHKIDIRHGDLTLNREPHPPDLNIAPAVGDLVLAGDSAPHILKHVPGLRYEQRGTTIYFTLPADSKLSHPTTHFAADVPAASEWVSRKLVEARTADDDAAVED